MRINMPKIQSNFATIEEQKLLNEFLSEKLALQRQKEKSKVVLDEIFEK